MDQNQSQQKELTYEESLKEVIHALPAPLRAYIASGRQQEVVARLSGKFGLRADQALVFERETTMLLMGIETPDEFAAALSGEAALPENTVRDVMDAVNREIFIPLQNQLRAPAQPAAPQGPKLVTPPAPSKPSVPAQKPSPLAEALVKAGVHPPSQAQLPPKTAMPQRAFPPRLPGQDLAKDHLLPLGEKDIPSFGSINRLKPKPSVPQNLPGAMPSAQVPSAPKLKVPLPVPPPPPPRPSAPAKPYSVDPYRESIE